MSRSIPLISILVSDDAYLVQKRRGQLKEQVLGSQKDEWNENSFSLKDHSLQDVLLACAQLPMMASYRFVWVSDGDDLKKNDLDLLLSYMQSPSPSTCLAIHVSKIDKRIKVWQKAVKAGFIEELKAPYPRQMSAWLFQEAKGMGLALMPPALQALVDILGNHLMAQVSALETLKTYLGSRKEVQVDDVEAVVGAFLSKNIFDLVGQIGAKKWAQAQNLLENILIQGEPLVRLVSMMARHFKLLLLAQESLRKKSSEQEAASQLGVHPFFVKDYLTQARQYSSSQLKEIYQRLLATDRSLKSSPVDPRFYVDKLMADICFGNP